MRNGPRPLPAHIGMAVSANAAAGGSVYCAQDMEHFLRGVQKYQRHTFCAPKISLERIWRNGQCQILSIPEYEYCPDQETLLLVPSLINKSNIFDLLPERSMLRWLCAQNINAYLLDWGVFSNKAKRESIETIIMDKLIPALSFLHSEYKSPAHILGYCMGGTLSLGAAFCAQEHVRSLSLLAAPWDFHAGSQALLNRIKFWAPNSVQQIAQKDLMSADGLQVLFASLDPAMTIEKFGRFLEMSEGSEKQKIFIAVEDWLNDGVDLPAGIARNCLQDWFLKNTPGRGCWELSGAPVDLSTLSMPVFVIGSSKDRLVEYDMAHAVCTRLADVQTLDPKCGHISMIAGGRSVQDVWEAIAGFVHKCT